MTPSDPPPAQRSKHKLRLGDLAAAIFLPPVLMVVVVLPRSLLTPLAWCIGRVFYAISRRERRILLGNLQRILGLPAGSRELRRMAERVAFLQVISSIETVRGVFRPGSVDVRGLDELRALVQVAESAGRGQLLITAHLGSWELLARSMAQVGNKRFHSLAKRSKTPAFTRFLLRLRRRAGTGVLWVDRRSLLREMLATLGRGEWLGFAMDQKPEALRGPVVDFFGRPTEFVSGPAVLAARSNSPVLAAFCVREGHSRYRVLCHQVLAANHGETDEQALTERFAKEIERAIRKYPDQWPWSYRRWYFEPEGPAEAGGSMDVVGARKSAGSSKEDAA